MFHSSTRKHSESKFELTNHGVSCSQTYSKSSNTVSGFQVQKTSSVCRQVLAEIAGTLRQLGADHDLLAVARALEGCMET